VTTKLTARRGSADVPVTGRPNGGRGAESSEPAAVLDRLGGHLQQLTRSIDTGAGEPPHRRHSGFLAKPAGECSSGHVRAPSERVEVMWKCEVLEHPVAKRAEEVAARLREQPFDEMSLPSLSLRRSDESTCASVGGCSAVVAPDEMKAQVDPRRHAGRGGPPP
jgi:hypothetical protein